MIDRLWQVYRRRVSYVAQYESLVSGAGASFINDHIAFRTLAWQHPQTGIASISRLFESLAFQPVETYQFPAKHLSAVHLAHPHPGLPRLFVSELKSWELSEASRAAIGRSLEQHREPPDVEFLAGLATGATPEPLERLSAHFLERPWPAPERSDVETLNSESQYAAWVLVHGYAVNHFTALINAHDVESLDSIEKTIAALRDDGVPMKSDIEGAPGSKLRQSATEAVVVDVEVSEQGTATTMPWTYAYFELAQRGTVPDPATGQAVPFEGFLGPQATHLFEMTRKS